MKKYEETKKLFDDVITLKEPERVPIVSNLWTWPLVWSDKYPLSEIVRDNDKYYDEFYEHVGNTGHDAYIDTTTRNAMRIYDAIGISGDYVIDDDKGFINHVEKVLLESSEYDEFIDDPQTFIYDKIFTRRMKALQGSKAEAKEAIRIALIEFLGTLELGRKLEESLANDFGMIKAYNGSLIPSMDLIINNMRGLKGTMMDMRRFPDKLDALVAKLNPMNEVFYGQSISKDAPLPVYPTATGLGCSIIGSYLLNKKQFERFCWPEIKRVTNLAIAQGHNIYMFCEGNTDHLYDLFLQFPKGRVIFQFENNDLREAKKVFEGHNTICGGISSSILSDGTVQECIDSTKALLDDVAPGGGFIFTEGKMMSYRNDGSPEKIKAVNKTVREYGRYKGVI